MTRRHRTGWFAAALGAAAVALAAGTSAAAAAPGCGVSWTGKGGNADWTTAANWNTGKVPGSTSNVCITGAGVVGPRSISVNSLQLLGGAQLDSAEQAGSSVTVATTLSVGSGLTQLLLEGSLSAASIDNAGLILADGSSSISAPSFSNTGTVDEDTGTLEIVDAPSQLQNGALNGGTFGALSGTIVLPEDITSISGGEVDVIDGGEVEDPAANDALDSLTSIGVGGILAATQSPITLNGSLVSAGTLNLGGYNGGETFTIAGTYTEESGAQGILNEATLDAGAVVVDSGATLEGSGSVNAPLTNAGTVAPANFLTVAGTYDQSATGALDTFVGAGFTVSGKATLSGALNIAFTARCPPPVGSSFAAITYASRSGLFTTHTSNFNLKVKPTEIDAVFEGAGAAAAAATAC